MSDPIDVNSREFVTALARGLDVLQACAASPKGVTLADAARQTGLARASVRRSLLTLCATGYVIVDGRMFLLTPKVLTLGAGLAIDSLPRLAQPLLDRLSRDFDESFSIATLDGPDILYVARSEARRIVALTLAVGSRLPAYCTSMGRVLLASLPPAEMERRLPESLLARTPRTVTDRTILVRLIAQVHHEGYCILDQELELGLRSLAVPVLNAAGDVVAALNVGTQAARTPLRDLRRVLLPALQEAALSLRPAMQKG